MRQSRWTETTAGGTSVRYDHTWWTRWNERVGTALRSNGGGERAEGVGERKQRRSKLYWLLRWRSHRSQTASALRKSHFRAVVRMGLQQSLSHGRSSSWFFDDEKIVACPWELGGLRGCKSVGGKDRPALTGTRSPFAKVPPGVIHVLHGDLPRSGQKTHGDYQRG